MGEIDDAHHAEDQRKACRDHEQQHPVTDAVQGGYNHEFHQQASQDAGARHGKAGGGIDVIAATPA
jgi:hypothetical protein